MTVQETTKQAADVVSVGVAGATLVDWLPSIAAGLSIIWLLMRMADWIYEKFKPPKD